MTGPTRTANLERARALIAAGAFEQAAAVARQAVKQHPSDAAALGLLSVAQAGMGDHAGARASLERCLKQRPGDVVLLADIARTYLNEGRIPEAVRAADRALRLAPASTTLIGLKAHILAFGGDAQGAWEVMGPAVEAGASDPGLATSLGQIAARVGRTGLAISMLRRCLEDLGLPPGLRAELYFRLGDVLDHEGDWDAAFAAYAEGNRIRRAGYRYDAGAMASAVDELIALGPPDAGLSAGRAAGAAADRPIFIVGMPRSGTSLVEQVLGSHPAVHPGGEMEDIQNLARAWQGTPRGEVPVFRRYGELTAARVAAAARAYLDRVNRMAGRAARVTDKMPVNFLHLGLVSLMLPEARTIHCTRDPIDTCLSCYFQNFSGPVAFAYDLAELGAFYRGYGRLMGHWERVLNLPMHTQRYEDVVADAERASRGLVSFAGLEWDERCLRFHESKRVVLTSSNDQVRRPVYSSSVGRWKRYEKHLGPLLGAMGG